MDKYQRDLLIAYVGIIIGLLISLFSPKIRNWLFSLQQAYQALVVLILILIPLVIVFSSSIYSFISIRNAYRKQLQNLSAQQQTLARIASERHIDLSKEHAMISPEEMRIVLNSFVMEYFSGEVPPFNRQTYHKDDDRERIPLCGDVKVSEEIRYLLTLPIVERLRSIKQLSFAYLLYPGAVHTRIEHSLGVMYWTSRICQNNRERVGFTNSEIRFAEIAALIHDIGHGSWGHGLEPLASLFAGIDGEYRYDKIRLIKFLSDENSPIARGLENIGITRKDMFDFFKYPENLNPKMMFVNDLIDSEVDVDRLDYINRDAYHANGPIGEVSVDSIVSNAIAKKNGQIQGSEKFTLVYDHSASGTLRTFVQNRDSMYAQVYEHDIKVSGEEMLLHAVFSLFKRLSLNENDLENILRLNDGDLLALLRLFGNDYERKMVQGILNHEIYFALDHFPVEVAEENEVSFRAKLYELASYLKIVGFNEKIEVERRFMKKCLSRDDPVPDIFFRAPDYLPKRVRADELKPRDDRKKAMILKDDVPVSLSSYFQTKFSVSPERKSFRVLLPPSLRDRTAELRKSFNDFVENERWKPHVSESQ